jgi:SAM-dependent methyltransferase
MARDGEMTDDARRTGSGGAAELSETAARTWIDRWDIQQQDLMPDREERFTALIDVVEELAGRPDPLVLDLGCGPGSLAARLLERIPAARVIAIDADPLLLALGQASRPSPNLRFVHRDLRVAGWSRDLGFSEQADAAVSTTALHWLPPQALAAVYAEVAGILRPGGVLLNGDHYREDQDAAPTLVRLGHALNQREEDRRAPHGRAETWTGWWEAAKADPGLAGLVAERERMSLESEHHGSPSGRLAVHVEAVRAAGFAEVGTLWQRGDNRLLCAVLGS